MRVEVGSDLALGAHAVEGGVEDSVHAVRNKLDFTGWSVAQVT
jgi:hypothetical protein